MIERRPGGWRVTVPMVIDNAAPLRGAGAALIDGGVAVVDLTAVGEADSSALAILLDWVRQAEKQGGSLAFRGAPSGVRALAGLYDLDGILPLV